MITKTLDKIAKSVDRKKLSSFIHLAKRNFLEDEGGFKRSRNGNNTYKFETPDFRYENVQYGKYNLDFCTIGQERISVSESPIWGMRYFGKIIDGAKDILRENEIIDFLKEALKLCPERFPFRGPINEDFKRKLDDFKVLSYHNKIIYKNKLCTIENFEGTEEIRFSNGEKDVIGNELYKTVFRQFYFGRILNPVESE